MKFDQVKELINIINESDVAYFEATIENDYIKMDKSLDRNTSSKNNNIQEKVINQNIENIEPIKNVSNIEAAISKDEVKEDKDFEYIKSPMVGTFYSASSPEAEPFTEEGKSVSKGSVVCIVEAMKLMNEIVADFNLEVVSVMVKNGDMVEYGQELFKVRRK